MWYEHAQSQSINFFYICMKKQDFNSVYFGLWAHTRIYKVVCTYVHTMEVSLSSCHQLCRCGVQTLQQGRNQADRCR